MAKTDIRLNNPRQVIRLLARIINELRNDEISESKARTISYSSQILLKAMENEEITKEVEKLRDTVDKLQK